MVLNTQAKRPLTHHAKKRQGLHHRTGKQYVKTYWPYLPMLLVVGLGVFLQTGWTHSSRVLGASTDISPTVLLQDTNIERGKRSEPALSMNDQLTKAAQAKADDMAARNYWSHTTPDGKQPWYFVRQAGYQYDTVGENLAYGFTDTQDAITAWLNSPEHRKNMLSEDYKDVGFGIASVPVFQGKQNQTVIVAMYGSYASSTAGMPASTTGQVLPARHVTRLETMTSGITKSFTIIVALLASAAIAVFIIKHGRMWRRAVNKGETFLVKHPVLDIAILASGVIGYLVTRTSGFIH